MRQRFLELRLRRRILGKSLVDLALAPERIGEPLPVADAPAHLQTLRKFGARFFILAADAVDAGQARKARHQAPPVSGRVGDRQRLLVGPGRVPVLAARLEHFTDGAQAHRGSGAVAEAATQLECARKAAERIRVITAQTVCFGDAPKAPRHSLPVSQLF